MLRPLVGLLGRFRLDTGLDPCQEAGMKLIRNIAKGPLPCIVLAGLAVAFFHYALGDTFLRSSHFGLGVATSLALGAWFVRPKKGSAEAPPSSSEPD